MTTRKLQDRTDIIISLIAFYHDIELAWQRRSPLSFIDPWSSASWALSVRVRSGAGTCLNRCSKPECFYIQQFGFVKVKQDVGFVPSYKRTLADLPFRIRLTVSVLLTIRP